MPSLSCRIDIRSPRAVATRPPKLAVAFVAAPEAKDVYKASPTTCKEAWVYLGDDDVVGFAASSSTVVGAGGTTVFALNP